MLEYQIQACKKSMSGKTWYVGTREVRSLYTLKDKVYMVSPETSIYKDLLISIAFPRFPLNPPFFFFFLVNLRNRLSIQQYHNISCPPQPPKMRITLFMLATLFHLALCRGSGSGGSDPGSDPGKDPGRDPGGEDSKGDKPEPLPPTVCCTKAPQCEWDPAVSFFF